MLDILVALIAMGSGGGGDAAPEAAPQALVAEEQVRVGADRDGGERWRL